MKTIEELKLEFPTIEFNKKYLEILNEIRNNDNCRLNIIGNAGSGKSTILKLIHSMFNDENVVTCSSTGTSSALLNSNNPEIKATTIHSLFGLGALDIYGAFEPHKVNKECFKLIETIDVLLIDEISMVNADVFDYISGYIDYACVGKNIRIILFGDVLQFPPVINDKNENIHKLFESLYNGNHFYFNSFAFRDDKYQTILLKKIYRQNGDNTFKDILNRIRVGKQTQEDLNIINKRVMNEEKWLVNHDSYLKIVTTNKEVEKNNQIALQIIDSPWINIDSTITNIEKFRNTQQYKSGMCPETISLKIGSQVMITRNAPKIGDCRAYVNGDIGILTECENDFAVVELNDGRKVRVEKQKTEVYDYKVEFVDNKAKVVPKVECSWENLPIKCCASLTSHKCQGKTLTCGYIDLGWFKPECAIYVILSRFTSMNDFALAHPIKMEDIKVNEEALKFISMIDIEEDDIDEISVNPKIALFQKFISDYNLKIEDNHVIDLDNGDIIL